MPRLAIEKWEQEHKKHVAEYLAQLDSLYEDATEQIVRMGLSYTYDPTTGKPFYFNLDKTRNQAVNTVLNGFREKIIGVVSAGIASEWAFANEKTDSWVRQLFSDPKKGYMLHNLKAMEAYTNRKSYGYTLSDRVWKYTAQFKQQVELSLSVGISEGRSAAQISQDIRIHLNEPEKLFRKVRNQFGELVLSKSAKAYHPGQGVYRSSYQNAMRMARTEINGAYREADYVRWQQLDFIVGIEIKTSKSHEAWLIKEWLPRFKKGAAPPEICDQMAGRYPKDFKFIGWHPNCRCYAVPIIANEDNDDDWWDEPKNEVTTTPSGYKDWVKKNKERILEAEERGKLPYFIKENKGYTNLRPERTEAQIKAIKDRWQTRKDTYRKAVNLASNVLNVAKQYPEVDAARLRDLLDNYRIKDMRKEAKKVASEVLAAKQDDKYLSALIPDVRMWKEQFSSEDLHKVYDAVEKSLTAINDKPLDMLKYNNILEQKKALISKEMLYVSDPNYLKPHTLYPTWQVSQAAYNKQLGIILDQIDWENIDSVLQDAVAFKTKSKIYLDLVDNLNVAVYKKNKAAAQNLILQIQTKQESLKKSAMSRLFKKASSINNADLPNLTSNEIDRLLDVFSRESIEEADSRLRGISERVWQSLTDQEKLILTKYTQTYSYLNEPLRGIPYYGSLAPNADHIHDLPILTSALEKFAMPQNTVVRRGVKDYAIQELGYRLSNVKVGDVFTDKGFLSTAVHRSKGFSQDYNLVICVPKGARGFYVEPLSHYTDYGKFDFKSKTLWDGKSVEIIREEAEWIGQRGSQFKVIKKEGRNIYLQLIGQMR